MKIKLINPGFKNMRTRNFQSQMNRYWFPILAMPMLSAVTPERHKVSFTDELFKRVDFNESVDLVGITGMTAQINRAYQIADTYREKGIPVILGGIHASSLPEEAKRHADSVVIGEADDIWINVLEDFEQNQLRPFYKKTREVNLGNLPWPNRNIYDGIKIPPNGTTNSVQVSRGCPYNCNFCSVTEFFGHKIRLRPVDCVIKEVKAINNPMICFVDDNILPNYKYSKELFTRLIDLNIEWGGQSTINIAERDEILKLCANSGCRSLLIGLESINHEAIQAMGKNVNKISKYKDYIKKIQDSGIKVLGSFIFGTDQDDPSVFECTWKFIRDSNLAVPLFNILTPFPNTEIFRQMDRDNRILTYDWSEYTTNTVVFKPKKMTAEQLLEGSGWLYGQQHYSIAGSVKANSIGWN